MVKKLPAIARQHYEKIVLVVMMLALAGAVYYLFLASQKEKETIQEYFRKKRAQNMAGVKPMDLTRFESARKTLLSPVELNFTTPHNLFNPVKWQEKPDGGHIKVQSAKDIGPYAVQVVEIRPLKLTIAFKRAAGTGFWIGLTNQMASPHSREYRGFDQYASLTGSQATKMFTLKEAKPADHPKEWVLELEGTGESVTITEEKPFVRVVGYETDLRYDLENKTMKDLKVGARIRLSGENYNIVAIQPKEVVLSADSNDRRYSIKTGGEP